jgi:hypothetical protein
MLIVCYHQGGGAIKSFDRTNDILGGKATSNGFEDLYPNPGGMRLPWFNKHLL